MPNVRKEAEPETGVRRAAEMNDSFLAVPGYADDSLLSVVRYVARVQALLRKCDFEAFLAELGAMDKCTQASAEQSGGPAARIEKIKEHRQQAYSKVEEFPELASGFEGFLTNSKSLKRQRKEAEGESPST